MFNYTKAFSSFSTNDIDATKNFYATVLGLQVNEDYMGMPTIHFEGGHSVAFYPKENHQPADFTIINFFVDDVESSVDHLVENGVSMEMYEGFGQDDKGIARMEGRPSAAWFKDPGGNVICLLESK